MARLAVRGTFSPTGPRRPASARRLTRTLGRICWVLEQFRALPGEVLFPAHRFASFSVSSVRFTMALRANALRRALSRTMSPAIAGDLSRSSRPCHCEAEDNNDSQRGPPPQFELAVSRRTLPALSNACRTLRRRASLRSRTACPRQFQLPWSLRFAILSAPRKNAP